MTDLMTDDAACKNNSLHAGLLGQLQDDPHASLPSPDRVLSKLQQPECLVLALLQRARRHPLVSDEFTLLLLERLEGVEISSVGTEGDGPQCSLTLHLTGTGSGATVMQRHLDDLRSLVSGLLHHRSVYSRGWNPTHSRWNYGDSYRLKAVVLSAPGGQSAWLSWPDLSFIGGGVGHPDPEPTAAALVVMDGGVEPDAAA
jgi:hypothetical protein